MSDIDRNALSKPRNLVARKCHCGDWAGFGFSKGDRDDWWCWTHYPYKTSARLEAAEIAAELGNRAA
ncbi:UNVERIFIED_ORG: hypothetical protein M2435_006396 [Rhizobium sophorae]|uniref:hypothetical protein n=1 Tax=Rhizobium leguminosarum TaxID=384 RepID=UPI00161DEDB9|nr:hypothetical protein [Rhizobium leguminosarum]MBB4526280.1 hypothetical protein [Rhizobium leguminosarum]MDH6663451.1 hypothetical protein [Rhizobium sophorae]